MQSPLTLARCPPRSQPTGHLFHIDFGYVFGRDPKWNPPPMRLTKEMVVAMGGLESEGYRNFRSFACQAYTILRKSAGLILNLIALMLDAGIGDIGREDIEKVLRCSACLRHALCAYRMRDPPPPLRPARS